MQVHTELEALLVKHGITWEEFRPFKGRPSKHLHYLVEIRRDIITELHLAGTPWTKMMEITGLSLGAIERGTRATWNEASKRNRQESAAKVARSRKGEIKPWLTEQLKKDWEKGKFDFHKGRVRSPEECEKLKAAGARPEVRKQRQESAKLRWKDPQQREHLLAFHRSEENRRRLSEVQSLRMITEPDKWGGHRGIGAWVNSIKCTRNKIWTRSSYERRAIRKLENDPQVTSFEFETRVSLSIFRWILPDFIVHYADGTIVLIEVKASWILSLPVEHKIKRRLKLAEDYAKSKGWGFCVWTEKELPSC